MSEAVARGTARPTLRDFLELSKARIVMMVLMTAGAGFFVARPDHVDLILLFHTLVGTAFVAGGTNALNQFMEREFDGMMARTRKRPLPDGRMSDRVAFGFAAGIAAFGAVYLWMLANPLASVLALTTLVTYLFLYTPLKRKTSLCTIIGAAPGAIPPMVGWAAASGSLSPGAWALFGIVFLWQIPHFLAIGWMYRNDYEKAGFIMLPARDRDGLITGIEAVAAAMLLVPLALFAPRLGLGGPAFAVGAAVAATPFLWAAIRFAGDRTVRRARRLFMMSNVYLLVVMAMVVAIGFL